MRREITTTDAYIVNRCRHSDLYDRRLQLKPESQQNLAASSRSPPPRSGTTMPEYRRPERRHIWHGRKYGRRARPVAGHRQCATTTSNKPIIAIANTQFVPGHETWKRSGHWSRARSSASAAPPGSSTPSRWMTASRWGHDGMLYSLPLARTDRRSGGVYGERALRRRAGASPTAMKITPGMLIPRCAQHPCGVCLGGPMDGSGKTSLRRTSSTWSMRWSWPPIRVRRTKSPLSSAAPKPDLVVSVQRHVHHRELDELPDRGVWACRCWATAPCWPPTPIARRCSRRRRARGRSAHRWYGAGDATALRAASPPSRPSRTR